MVGPRRGPFVGVPGGRGGNYQCSYFHVTNRIRLLVVRFHECRKMFGKGKVRIVIELDVLKSWKRKRVG